MKTKATKKEKILARVDALGIRDGLLITCVFPETSPRETWEGIVRAGEEGMVAKRVGSRYQHTRSSDWVKLKTWKEEDFEVVGITSEKREVSALVLDNGMKVNCALGGAAYAALLSDLMRSGEVMTCADGTLATRITKHYKAKVKFLHKSASGLRFPILHQLEGF